MTHMIMPAFNHVSYVRSAHPDTTQIFTTVRFPFRKYENKWANCENTPKK